MAQFFFGNGVDTPWVVLATAAPVLTRPAMVAPDATAGATIDDLWWDPTHRVWKKCTSVSPYTWVEVGTV